MGVRFLRFDILPSSSPDELEEAEVGEEVREEAREAGGEGGGEAGEEAGELRDDEMQADEAFCHVVEPGNAGLR